MKRSEALTRLADNFQIQGPDADGLLWLILQGNGTTGQAMFNLGRAKGIASQVALALEEDRKAALALQEDTSEIEQLRAQAKRAHEAISAMQAEFRGYDLPYGSKAYALANEVRLELEGWKK